MQRVCTTQNAIDRKQVRRLSLVFAVVNRKEETYARPPRIGVQQGEAADGDAMIAFRRAEPNDTMAVRPAVQTGSGRAVDEVCCHWIRAAESVAIVATWGR
jgi:hypothetical protein